MAKILIGVNTLTEIRQPAYMNHNILWYRLGRSYRNHDFGICTPRRMSIDNMRNFCAKAAIEQDFDYLWFIDDDVLLQPDALRHLLDLKSDIAAGVTLVRTYPYAPMLFSFEKDRKSPHLDEYETLWGKDGSIRSPKLGAVGFSCCLIKVPLLKKIEPPWFLTGPNFTEDVFFCQRASGFKKSTTIAATRFVITEHLLGDDSISPQTRKARMRFDEAQEPNLKKLRGKKGNFVIVPANRETTNLTNGRAVGLAKMYAPLKRAV